MLILRWQNKDYNHNHDDDGDDHDDHDIGNNDDNDDDEDDDDDQVLVGGGHELAAVVSVTWPHNTDVGEALQIVLRQCRL